MIQSPHGPGLYLSKWPGPITGDKWEDRVRINARRVREGWSEFLSGFPWEWAVSLTFDPRRAMDTGQRTYANEQTVSREVHRWCGDLARMSRRPVVWAFAIEGGGGSHLHAHALIIDARDAALEAAQRVWEARNGTVAVKPVDDIGHAARYMCKALGPNGEVVLSDTLRRHHGTRCAMTR